jgi:hypothetical protein
MPPAPAGMPDGFRHRIGAFRRTRSVRRGPLENLLADSADSAVRLPLDDVDVLVLEAGS